VIVVVTDGRATSAGPAPAGGPSAGNPVEAARAAAAALAAAGIEALVVDAEDGDVRLGLAHELAEAMGAHYAALPGLRSDTLTRAVETVMAAEPSS
jgi:magnesium chelatase subunit D